MAARATLSERMNELVMEARQRGLARRGPACCKSPALY